MLDAATAPNPEPTQQDAHRALLDELIGVGAALVRKLAAQDPTPEAVQAYHTLTRSIRRSMLLAKHLRDHQPAKAAAPAANKTAARKQVLRALEDAIQRKHHGEPAERLRAELLDHLDSPDTHEQLDTRPVADVVQDLTRDMGLAIVFDDGCRHPWKRRTPHDVATLRAHALGLPPPPPDPDPGRWHHPDPPPRPRPSDENMVAQLLGQARPPPRTLAAGKDNGAKGGAHAPPEHETHEAFVARILGTGQQPSG